jgi:copper chaperone CopZ
VSDIDPSHYPYEAALEVGGMTCEHCVSNVTNALDGVEGTWATVELAGGQARVRSKSPIKEDLLRAALEAAGYRLVSLR